METKEYNNSILRKIGKSDTTGLLITDQEIKKCLEKYSDYEMPVYSNSSENILENILGYVYKLRQDNEGNLIGDIKLFDNNIKYEKEHLTYIGNVSDIVGNNMETKEYNSPVMMRIEQNKINQLSKQLEQFNTEINLCSEVLHNAGYQYHHERLRKSYQELVDCIEGL